MTLPRAAALLVPLLSPALVAPALVGAGAVATAPCALAQKVDRRYVENPVDGYKFKPLEDMSAVPVDDRGLRTGLVSQLTEANCNIWIYSMLNPESDEEVEDGRSTAKKKRVDVAEALVNSEIRGFDKSKITEPLEDETSKVGGIEARRRVWKTGDKNITAWTFPLAHADISLVYETDLQRFDTKWERAIDKSAKTFRELERITLDFDVSGELTYDQMIKKTEFDHARDPGWRVLDTPSEKFIIVTACENEKFVDEVIKRLEASREVFEEDYPPPPDFDDVSIVRICKDEQQFHEFGNTGGGVAGWFSPQTTELVLYDDVANNRNATYAVATHEAFHQYCHFLFAESEAHRWFDEGHGDYYGGMEMVGSRMKVKRQMPGGLDRLTVIREMVRTQTYASMADHVNFNHGQWQTQGPSNVSCYAQSWSLIFFLRQGSEGQVSRKVWKDEYADIIPNYVSELTKGYVEAYEAILEKRRERAKRDGEDPEAIDTRVGRFALFVSDPGAKERIWKRAMDASWGKIDMDQFEADWLLYVQDFL